MNTYKMTLEDSVDSMTFDLLEVPIVDKDVEGAVDNTTLDGNIFTDYLWLKKNYVQKWSIMCDDEYSRLRGFYTRQFDNASVPTYKLFYGENISQDQAVSGDYILVNNPTDRNAPITSFELLGDAEQDGTPTPDAPQAINTVTGEQTVKIEGKNLFDGSIRTLGTPSNTAYANTTKRFFDLSTYVVGITRNNYYNASGSCSINSDGSLTITATQGYYGVGFPFRLNAGTYTYSMSITGASSLLTVTTYADDGTYLSEQHGTSSVGNTTFTLTEDTNVLLGIMPESATTITASNIQLELGNQASSYEPYQGQTKPVNLGKNLFDKDNIPTTNNLYIDSSGAVATGDGNRFTYLQLKPNTTYTLTQSVKGGTNIRFALFSQVPANGTQGTLIGTTYTTAPITLTFTTTATNYYIGWAYANVNNLGEHTVSEILGSIQIERGSVATSYAPYFTPIELVKIGNYQDRIYKSGGKWYIEKQIGKVVLDGTVAFRWGVANTGTPNYLYYYQNISDAVTGATLMSNYGTGNTLGGSDTNQGIMIAGGGLLRVRYGAEIPIADWRAKFSTTPMILYYPLATPTTTEITNSELVGQLEAILQAYLYTGTNNISNNAVSPNLAGQMNIGYRLIFSEETVLIEPTAVRLTLTDGGIINVCGCRQNVQLTMRETIQ